jgi:sugar phosphate isomerase/epimerase
MGKIRLAFSSNAFKRFPLDDCIRDASRFGYDGIELMCDAPHVTIMKRDEGEACRISDSIRRHGLSVSNLNAFTMSAVGSMHHPSWIEPDQAQRELRVNHTLNCLWLAKQIGAKSISTQPGGPMPDAPTHVDCKSCGELRKSFDKSVEAQWRRDARKLFAEGLKAVIPAAEGFGVKILIEPEPELLLSNSAEMEEFFSEFDSPAIAMNFDIGHFFCAGEDPATLIRKWAKRIGHFHIEDIGSDRKHFHLLPGAGVIDFDSVFAAIRDIGYEGWMSVELYTYAERPANAARKARKFLKKYL